MFFSLQDRFGNTSFLDELKKTLTQYLQKKSLLLPDIKPPTPQKSKKHDTASKHKQPSLQLNKSSMHKHKCTNKQQLPADVKNKLDEIAANFMKDFANHFNKILALNMPRSLNEKFNRLVTPLEKLAHQHRKVVSFFIDFIVHHMP